jgi:hypothetical protein
MRPYLRTSAFLPLVFTALATATIVLPILPGTQISIAEGCSGAYNSPICEPEDLHVELTTTEVPTNAGVLVTVVKDKVADPSCPKVNFPEEGHLTGKASDDKGVEIPGTFSEIFSDYKIRLFLWKPSSPLSSDTNYKLNIKVENTSVPGTDGAGGAEPTPAFGEYSFAFHVGTKELAMTLPKVTSETIANSKNQSVCCSDSTHCNWNCEPIIEESQPQLHVNLQPFSEYPMYYKYTFEPSDTQGNPGSNPQTILGIAQAPTLDFYANTQGFPCVKVHISNVMNTNEMVSEVLCPKEISLPSKTVHCERLITFKNSCQSTTTVESLLESYPNISKVCNTDGTTKPNSQDIDTNTPSEPTPTIGSFFRGGDAIDPNSTESGGCQMGHSGNRSSQTAGLFVLIAGLGIWIRRKNEKQ